MAYEQRDMSGSLFVNKKREKPSHPNARGDAMIDGKLYEVSAWTKTDRNGQKWQSLAFRPKESPPSSQDGPLDFEDDVPW